MELALFNERRTRFTTRERVGRVFEDISAFERSGVSSKETNRGKRMRIQIMTEPTEAECFEAEQELLFDVHFRQLDREIRKMVEQDKQKGAKNTDKK